MVFLSARKMMVKSYLASLLCNTAILQTTHFEGGVCVKERVVRCASGFGCVGVMCE